MSQNVYSFAGESPKGGGSSHVSMISCDGSLSIHDTRTSSLISQYLASSNQSLSNCTAVSWKPFSINSLSSYTRKSRKGSASSSVTETDIIAVGTSCGSTFLYSIASSSITHSIERLHGSKITSLTWSIDASEVWSASEDGHIGKWLPFDSDKKPKTYRPQISNSTSKFASIAICSTIIIVGTSDSKILILNSDKPKCVLIELNSFHKGSVDSLKLVSNLLLSTGSNLESDHCVNVWNLNSIIDLESREVKSAEPSSMSPRATLNVNEMITSLDVCGTETSTLVGVLVKSGVAYTFDIDSDSSVFRDSASPKKKKMKNIRYKHKIGIALEADTKLSGDLNSSSAPPSPVRKISVVAISLSVERNITVVYSIPTLSQKSSMSKSNLKFHALDLDDLKNQTEFIVLKESDLTESTISNEMENGVTNKVMIASNKSGSVSVIGPDFVSAKTARQAESLYAKSEIEDGGDKSDKRKVVGQKADKLTMYDRLRMLTKNNDGMDPNSTRRSTSSPSLTSPIPRTETLINLLMQGLASGDRKILDSVLDRADDNLIKQTVKRLPVGEAIPKLIWELCQYIKGRGMINHAHAKWLSSIIQHHAAYVMTDENCISQLTSVQAMLKSRTRYYVQLVQMKGKLDLITKQIAGKSGCDNDDDFFNNNFGVSATSAMQDSEALLVYEDTNDMINDLLVPSPEDDVVITDDENIEEGEEDTSDDEQESEGQDSDTDENMNDE